jgi:hypothetical protein
MITGIYTGSKTSLTKAGTARKVVPTSTNMVAMLLMVNELKVDLLHFHQERSILVNGEIV